MSHLDNNLKQKVVEVIEGNPQHALLLLSEIQSLYPKEEEVYFYQIRCFLKLSSFSEAETAAQKAVALFGSVESYGWLSQVFLAENMLDKAEKIAREATCLGKDLDVAYSYLAVVLSAKGLLDEAEICLKKAIRLNGNKAIFHMLLKEIQNKQRLSVRR